MFAPPTADSPTQAPGPGQPTAGPHAHGGPARVAHEGAELREAVDVLRMDLAGLVTGLDPDAVAAQDAPDLWAGFARIERLASAAMTLLARRVEETSCWKEAGMRSAVEYLAQRSGNSRQSASEALATSKQLPKLPEIDTALRTGGLSAAQAHLVTDAAGENPSAQHRLLDAARMSSIKELRDECGRVKAAADPDPEATRKRQKAGRRLRQFSDAEGFWHAHAKGHPDVAGVFNAALEPIIDEMFRQARSNGRREPREALAFDALVEMARRVHAASYDSPSTSGGDRRDIAGEDDSGTAADGQQDEDDGDSAGFGDGPDHSAQLRLPDHGASQKPPSRTEYRARLRKRRKKSTRRRQSDPTHLPVLRVDLEALRRGHVQDGELCEITGLGAISVEGARERLGESVVKLVVSSLGNVISVIHLGRGPQAKRRLGIQGSPLSEASPDRPPTHLALVHVSTDAIRRDAEPGDPFGTVAGIGRVSLPAARALLGSDLLELACRRSVPVAQLIHRGRKPTVAQRIALLWTQPACSVAGCPHGFTEIDHRHDWAKTHHTRLDALDRLCPHHHRLKTHHSWALVPGTGKRPFVPPQDPRHPGNKTTTPESGSQPDPSTPHQDRPQTPVFSSIRAPSKPRTTTPRIEPSAA